MDCTGVAGYLVGYHLGTLTEEECDRVEEHLVACSTCLRTYLALKRAGDQAKLERPRPEVRKRLRADVARTFQAKETSHVRVWARRIPLYQGVALAALAACIALAAPSVIQRISSPDSSTALPSIDTSRTRAESLHIY